MTRVALWALLWLALPSLAFAQLATFTVESVELVASKRITRTQFEYTYRASVRFNGTGPAGAAFTVGHVTTTADPAYTSFFDDQLDLGNIPAGGTASDTFRIVHSRTTPFNAPFSFTFDYDPSFLIIPDVTGLTRAEAGTRLTAAGLPTIFENYRNSSTVPAGRIISQSPPPPLAYYFPGSDYAFLTVSVGDGSTDGFALELPGADGAAIETGYEVTFPCDVTTQPGQTEPITVRIEDSFRSAGLSAEPVTFEPGYPRGRLTLRAAATTYEGLREVMIVASDGSAEARRVIQVTVEPPAPSAGEKVAAALASGAIDLETSYVYRMYALFGDARLPEEYRGRVSDLRGPELFDTLSRTESTLSPATRALLRPFTARPADPVSVWSQSALTAAPSGFMQTVAEPAVTILPEQLCPPTVSGPTWVNRRVTQGGVSILLWIRCSDEGIQTYRHIVLEHNKAVLEKVLGPMIDLMGPPLPDLGVAPGSFDPDSAIDVYIVSPTEVVQHDPVGFGESINAHSAAGLATGVFVGYLTKSSGWILVEDLLTSATDPGPRSTLIHELFHVQEFAHRSDIRFNWLIEASATWAETHFDFLLPWPKRGSGILHKRWFPKIQYSTQSLADQDGSNEYASYLWPFYMQLRLGRSEGAAAVAEMWDRFESLPEEATGNDTDEVIDQVFPFKDHLADFRLTNLNVAFAPGDSLDDFYQTIDFSQFPEPQDPISVHFGGPSEDPVPTEVTLTTSGQPNPLSGTRTVPVSIEPLSTHYIEIEVNDKTTRYVQVDWSSFSQTDSLSFDAMTRVRDQEWERRRVKARRRTTFCIPDGFEVRALQGWLVFTNYALLGPEPPITGDVVITYSNQPNAACGCNRTAPSAVPAYCAEELASNADSGEFALPRAVNDAGQAAGVMADPFGTGILRPVVWTYPDFAQTLRVPDLQKPAHALRLTDDGEVSGFYLDTFPNSQWLYWPSILAQPTLLGSAINGNALIGQMGMNNSAIAAYASNSRVYLWQNGSFLDIGSGEAALDVNEFNHALIQEAGTPPSYWLWRSGVRTPLPLQPRALNDLDVVVGIASGQAARWSEKLGLQSLALPAAPPPGTTFLAPTVNRSEATDINTRGEIVGSVVWFYPYKNPQQAGSPGLYVTHGLHWKSNGQVLDLNDAVPVNADVTVPTAINDNGVIVGAGAVMPPNFNCAANPPPFRCVNACIGNGLTGCAGNPPIRLVPQRP